MRHQLVRLLARSIEADGMVHIVMNAEGYMRVYPID
jgi:hypothetical protein